MLMNELSNVISQENEEFKTKLYKALNPNEDGMVSAKALYDLLRLSKNNYADWCKNNFYTEFGLIDGVVENGVVDSFPTLAGKPQGGRPTQDYLITLRIAEKLCLKSKSEFKDEILNYFLDLEESAPKALAALQEQAKIINQLVERVEQYGRLAQQTQEQLALVQKDVSTALAGVNALNSGILTAQGREAEWINEVSLEIEKLAKHWGRHDPQICVMWLIDELDGKDGYPQIAPYKFIEYKRQYIADHPGTKPTRLTVVASDSQYRALFTEVLHRKLQEYDEEFDEQSSLFSRMIVELGDPVEGGRKNDEPDWNDPAFLALCDEFDAYRKRNEEMDALQREAMTKMKPGDFWDFDDIID